METVAVKPATLSGTGLTLADLEALIQDMEAVTPWRQWMGKAELRVVEDQWLAPDTPAVVLKTSEGAVAFVKKACLDELRKAWDAVPAVLGRCPIPVSDGELAAILCYLADHAKG